MDEADVVEKLQRTTASIEQYRGFDDFVITDVVWVAPGYEISVTIVSATPGRFNRADDQRVQARLQLGGVQEFCLTNHFNEHQLREPDRVDWAHATLAAADVRRDTDPDRPIGVNFVVELFSEQNRLLKVRCEDVALEVL